MLLLQNDLVHVYQAEIVTIDSLCIDMKNLLDEIDLVHNTATVQADELQKAGLLKLETLNALKEQHTDVKSIDSVPQYNQINHLSGRTSMDRFSLNARASAREVMEFAEGVKVKFSSLLRFWGEDEAMESNHFFGTIKAFLNEFHAAAQHVEREEKRLVSV